MRTELNESIDVKVPRRVAGAYEELQQPNLTLNLCNVRGNCDIPHLGWGSRKSTDLFCS